MYLSIDLGDKRCWIAVQIESIVIPKAIVLRPKLVPELKKLIKQYSITHIIVWLPYDLYWKDSKQLNKTIVFIEKLKNIFPELIIKWYDERFTTFEANLTLNKIWIKNTRGNKDDISAVIILESYLKGNQA